MHGACNGKKNLAPPPGALGRGQMVKYHLISITKSISKIFIPKHIRQGFYSVARGGTFGHWGCPRGQKFIFFKHGHVAYQIDRGDEQNRMLVKFSS